MRTMLCVAAMVLAIGCGGGSKKSTLPEGDDEEAGYEPSGEDEGTMAELPPDKLDDVQALFARKHSTVARCYTKRLEDKPDLAKGEFVVDVKLAGGKAAEVVVKGKTWRDNVIEGCIAGHVKSWTFPQMEGTLPYSFTYVMDKF